jgi:dihydroorotate dehydrogenase (fumarate)
MTDLKTTYLGLQLDNPLVPSASPLSRDMGSLRQLEDAGAGAVVMYSLFEEEIDLENQLLDATLIQGTDRFQEAMSYFPETGAYRSGPDAYLEAVRQAKEALAIPVIGSLNGVSTGGWTRYARLIEQAGADALELNLYFLPTDSTISGCEVDWMYVDLVRQVAAQVEIPLAVKVSPFFSSIPNSIAKLGEAGAIGAVLFNRFYQPDLDLETLEVVPRLTLSQRSELLLPLRWIAIMYGRVEVDFALTSGVHTAEDALKGIAAGAQVVMLASELLQRGIGRLTDIRREMSAWLDEREYSSVNQLRGSLSQLRTAEPAAFERANYMRVLGSYSAEHR